MSLSAWVVSGAARLSAAVPVDPDAETAQRWARDELLDPIYHERPSLLSQIVDWIQQQLESIKPSDSFSSAALVVVVLLIVGAVVLAFVLNGPVRRARRVGSAGSVLDADDARTSEQIRRAADAAASAQDWDLAVVERFRAIVRSLEERTVLEERAGQTAHEAADAAAVRLPDHGSDLVSAGRLFDAVAYGHETATPEDDRRLRELDARVRAARPLVPSVAGAAAASVPS